MSQMDYQSNMPKDSGSDRRISGSPDQPQSPRIEQPRVNPYMFLPSCLKKMRTSSQLDLYLIHTVSCQQCPRKGYVMQLFNDEILDSINTFGISKRHVRDAALDADRIEPFEVASVKGEFRIKYFAENGFHVLLETSVKKGVESVAEVFVVYPDLLPDINKTALMKIYMALAERFGIPFTIGNMTQKYFHDAQVTFNTFDPSEGIKLITGSIPKNTSFSLCWKAKFDKIDEGTRGHFVMAFARNDTEYLQWLADQKRLFHQQKNR